MVVGVRVEMGWRGFRRVCTPHGGWLMGDRLRELFSGVTGDAYTCRVRLSPEQWLGNTVLQDHYVWSSHIR